MTVLNNSARWPLGCHSLSSCSRHSACMYTNCVHEGRDILPDIDAETAMRAVEQLDNATTQNNQLQQKELELKYLHKLMVPFAAQINNTPELLSILYDIDLLPEQITTEINALRMISFCDLFKRIG